jgi:hypothetical protein
MNADQIRAAFIKRQLVRALSGHDHGNMMRTVREFRKYLQWCADSLKPRDRKSIGLMLSRLEHRATR